MCHLRSPISGRRGRYPDRPTVCPRLELRPHLVLRSSLRKRWNLSKNVGHPSRRLLPIAPSGGSRTPSGRPRQGILPCRFWSVKCIILAMVFPGIPKRFSFSSSKGILLLLVYFDIHHLMPKICDFCCFLGNGMEMVWREIINSVQPFLPPNPISCILILIRLMFIYF